MVREKRSRKIAIGVAYLFCGLMAIYTWTIGVRLVLFSFRSIVLCFFFVDVLRLCLVPSGVFIAVFSHAGGRLYIELKES